jgi:hypothetical protein
MIGEGQNAGSCLVDIVATAHYSLLALPAFLMMTDTKNTRKTSPTPRMNPYQN